MMEPSRSTVDEGGKVGVGRAIGAGGDRVLREGIEEVLDFCKECVTKEKVLEYRAKSASLSLGHKVQMLSPIDMNGNIFEAPLYWDIYAGRGFDSSRICFSCHNFEYRGVASASELVSCGLNVHHVNRQDRLQDNSSHGRISLLKLSG